PKGTPTDVPSSQQWGDRLPAIDTIGPAGGVVEFAVRSHAEAVEHRGRQVFGSISLGLGKAAVRVGPADDAAGLDSASGEEAGEHVAPMMPARSEKLTGDILPLRADRRDPRRAAHLAAHHHQRLVEESALVEVLK